MRRALLLAFGLALLAAGPASAQMCLQDQYGNQYNFTIDAAHKYVFGTLTSAQNCTALTWPVLGSYTTGPLVLELTAANPLGDGDPNCISEFKLKGNYPNFAWYYDFGYGDQESQYVSCGAPPPADANTGGARRHR